MEATDPNYNLNPNLPSSSTSTHRSNFDQPSERPLNPIPYPENYLPSNHVPYHLDAIDLTFPQFQDLRRFHFKPSQEPDFTTENIIHMHIACSQFYKMSTRRQLSATSFPRPYQHQHGRAETEVIESVTYIVNEKTERTFQQCKSTFSELGVSNQEILLFHGTDEINVDNIFLKNFDIDHVPINRQRKKMMAHGRGIYMSDSPSMCKKYGNRIILSRVLLGTISVHSKTVPKVNNQVHIIHDTNQILPYCVITMASQGDKQHSRKRRLDQSQPLDMSMTEAERERLRLKRLKRFNGDRMNDTPGSSGSSTFVNERDLDVAASRGGAINYVQRVINILEPSVSD